MRAVALTLVELRRQVAGEAEAGGAEEEAEVGVGAVLNPQVSSTGRKPIDGLLQRCVCCPARK